MNVLCSLCCNRLSAFVSKCFHEARDFIPVDDSKIAETLSWMIRHQARNGFFPEPGRVYNKNLQVHVLGFC